MKMYKDLENEIWESLLKAAVIENSLGHSFDYRIQFYSAALLC